MKRFARVIIVLMLLITIAGCAAPSNAQIAATTRPVYEFTDFLCRNTPLNVTLLVTEDVSCLHDYTLQVKQMRAIEAAEVIVISGAGLEAFLEDVLPKGEKVIDASSQVDLLYFDEEEIHSHDHVQDHHHNHRVDPHIWLSISNAILMVDEIYLRLSERYPEYEAAFSQNHAELTAMLQALSQYALSELSCLSSRELITFHDGFAYFARENGLTILRAVEEEAGSEASALELRELIQLVRLHDLPAIFTEINGSTSAAQIIAAETGVTSYPLDMAMGNRGYFDAMYHNIDRIKEALS